MIDPTKDKLITMPEVQALLPHHVAIETVIRWRVRGLRGIKLETMRISGRVYTTERAVWDFFRAANEAGYGDRGGENKVERYPNKRTKRATKRLKAAGA